MPRDALVLRTDGAAVFRINGENKAADGTSGAFVIQPVIPFNIGKQAFLTRQGRRKNRIITAIETACAIGSTVVGPTPCQTMNCWS